MNIVRDFNLFLKVAKLDNQNGFLLDLSAANFWIVLFNISGLKYMNIFIYIIMNESIIIFM